MKCMKCLGSEPDYLMEDFPEVKICPNCGGDGSKYDKQEA